ncbi:hypothetical protein RB195_026248 [Necator americanus]|uniref:ZP domain-containing protein n=1 Tax=Necator americanus TaxID=51031 RepID=A0ABR1EWJ7_NECAM
MQCEMQSAIFQDSSRSPLLELICIYEVFSTESNVAAPSSHSTTQTESNVMFVIGLDMRESGDSLRKKSEQFWKNP